MGTRRRTGKEVCRRQSAVSRSRKLARRPSFGSELLAARGAADGSHAFFLTLREMARSSGSAGENGCLREVGGYAIPAEVAIDGTSAFSAIITDPVELSSENSMAGHLW